MNITSKITSALLRNKAEEMAADIPKIKSTAIKAAMSILQGNHGQLRAGTGEKFWQYREYDIYDRPEDIDWRQSAKNDNIYIRQKEWQTVQTNMFWVQNNVSMKYRSSKELPYKNVAATTIALAIAVLMTRDHEQAGPLDGSFSCGRTSSIIDKLSESFLYKQGEGISSVSSYTVPKNSNIILCGDFLDPLEDIEKAISPLTEKASRIFIIQVMDPAELDLPYEGRVIFDNKKSMGRFHINNVQSIKAEYQENISNHLNELDNLCKKYGWLRTLYNTDNDMIDALLSTWVAISGDNQINTGIL
jgi:uncharacterized protein (DUF58 family)